MPAMQLLNHAEKNMKVSEPSVQEPTVQEPKVRDLSVQEPAVNEVMDYRGLSKYLKMSHGTLRHKVMRGKIPFFKIDSSVRFSKKHIDKWLEGQHRDLKRKKAETSQDNSGELFTFDEDDI
jgi:excisionase family DNA binding protein